MRALVHRSALKWEMELRGWRYGPELLLQVLTLRSTSILSNGCTVPQII